MLGYDPPPLNFNFKKTARFSIHCLWYTHVETVNGNDIRPTGLQNDSHRT